MKVGVSTGTGYAWHGCWRQAEAELHTATAGQPLCKVSMTGTTGQP